jgi:hypothetical protein
LYKPDEIIRALDAGELDGEIEDMAVIEIDRLRAEVERLKAEQRDERAMLVGVSRAYMACHERFGQIGSDAYMLFPRIQGFRQWDAVKVISEIEGELTVLDPTAVAERCVRGTR